MFFFFFIFVFITFPLTPFVAFNEVSLIIDLPNIVLINLVGKLFSLCFLIFPTIISSCSIMLPIFIIPFCRRFFILFKFKLGIDLVIFS